MEKTFKHVNYLWDKKIAASFNDNQVELFLYRSNLLGSDLRITNYGGGNTSCKTIEKDPLTNNCLLYTSPSPRDRTRARMPSSA